MKIAIVTFHNAFNYGATLQCAALSKMLSDQGMNVTVIDYLPHYVEKKKSVFRYLMDARGAGNKLKAAIKGLVYLRYAKEIRERNKAFDAFVREHLNLTNKYASAEALEKDPPEADVYICGSDQVWNRVITDNRFDDAFFLRFVKNGAKVAYAVSLGETKPAAYQNELVKLTKGFRFISVREEDMAAELGNCISSDVLTVVDPTLLLEEADYRTFEKPASITKNRYLLLYNIQNSEVSTGLARKISREKGLEIVDVSPNPFQKIKGSKKKISVGPSEFLTLIKDADYVVTNSFHGTVFSLIYRKLFFTVPHKKRSGRMVRLLQMAGLEDRLFDSLDNVVSDVKIDYDEVWKRIHKASDESRELLIGAIQS